jgi:hypothetical protein
MLIAGAIDAVPETVTLTILTVAALAALRKRSA